MVSKKNKVEEIFTPIKEIPILKKKNDGSFYIKKKEAKVIGKRMFKKEIIDKGNDQKINGGWSSQTSISEIETLKLVKLLRLTEKYQSKLHSYDFDRTKENAKQLENIFNDLIKFCKQLEMDEIFRKVSIEKKDIDYQLLKNGDLKFTTKPAIKGHHYLNRYLSEWFWDEISPKSTFRLTTDSEELYCMQFRGDVITDLNEYDFANAIKNGKIHNHLWFYGNDPYMELYQKGKIVWISKNNQ